MDQDMLLGVEGRYVCWGTFVWGGQETEIHRVIFSDD